MIGKNVDKAYLEMLNQCTRDLRESDAKIHSLETELEYYENILSDIVNPNDPNDCKKAIWELKDWPTEEELYKREEERMERFPNAPPAINIHELIA